MAGAEAATRLREKARFEVHLRFLFYLNTFMSFSLCWLAVAKSIFAYPKDHPIHAEKKSIYYRREEAIHLTQALLSLARRGKLEKHLSTCKAR